MNTLSIIYVSITIVALLTMAMLLFRSIRKTLYSYTNVVLLAASLFLLSFLIILILFHQRWNTPQELIVSFPKYFSYIATGVISLASLLVFISNLSLIRHEGFCLNNLLGLLLGGFYLGTTVAFYFLASFLEANLSLSETMIKFNSALSLFVLTMLSYFESIFVSTCIFSLIAAKKKPAHNKDFIIVLGCSIDKRGGLLPLLKGRTNRAIQFAWEQEIECNKPCHYVPSGGQGPNEIMSEGSAMELYLLSHGAETYEVFPEKKSTSTYENFLFSKKIIDELNPNAVIAFATTNYHVFRSGLLARKAGFQAEGIGSATKWYFWPNGFVREFFAILTMKKRAHLTVAALLALISASFVFFVH